MDIYEAFVVGFALDQEVAPPDPPPRRQYRWRPRTSQDCMELMGDHEFLRTFRFSKNGVRRIVQELGMFVICYYLILSRV